MKDDRYGEIDIDTSAYEENPIDEFLKDKRSTTSEKNVVKWRMFLKEAETGTAFQQFIDQRQKTVFEVSVADINEYVEVLQSQNGTSTIRIYLNSLSAFYEELRSLGIHDSNPPAYVIDNNDYAKESPDREHHTVEEIGDFVKKVPDPVLQTSVLTLLKTGIRAGEVCNIDLCCLNLDFPAYRDYLKKWDITIVNPIKDRPDTVYIPANISAGDILHGEERADGNKRKRDTTIPIDVELKRSLIDWLSIRPDTPGRSAHPLFTSKEPVKGTYKRQLAASLYTHVIQKYSKEAGLTKAKKDASDVDLHYFRHFFTTQMTKNHGDHDGGLDPMLVKYIRGDTLDDDILNIYTHDGWGVNVRDEYLENIYNFGIYE